MAAAGDTFIWLSGASRQVLDQCPTERPKFIGLGASILVTAGMAAVSLSFALYTALKAPIWLAVIFALLWGLAIMSLDRLFVVSLHRYRNRFFYLLLAAPRFVMAVLLGFVISTPFVLQIFQPEIQHQIKLMQAAERAAYFQSLPHNPVYLDVQRDQTEVTNLTDEGATGGAAINPATDPTIIGWRRARYRSEQRADLVREPAVPALRHCAAWRPSVHPGQRTARHGRPRAVSVLERPGVRSPEADTAADRNAGRPEHRAAAGHQAAGPDPARDRQAGAE